MRRFKKRRKKNICRTLRRNRPWRVRVDIGPPYESCGVYAAGRLMDLLDAMEAYYV